jgi:hypothetical protein
VEKIVDGRALAQKLRIGDDVEFDRSLQALANDLSQFAGGADGDGGLDGDDLVLGHAAGDLPGDAWGTKIRTAVVAFQYPPPEKTPATG